MILLTALRFNVSWLAPCHSAGYSSAPTPMMAPCPDISRGTEWTVPIVPGLVRLSVVPWKSSTVSLLLRALRTMSSYAVQKCVKSMASVDLMLGTSSVRVPSGLAVSMARPRLRCAGVIRTGLPSCSPKPVFICGMSATAVTIAEPVRWVELALPPRLRARGLLMTTLLSMRSLAGTERTLVAVGTVRLDSMLTTVRAAALRNAVSVSWLTGPVGVIAGTSRGMRDSIDVAEVDGEGEEEGEGDGDGEVEGDGDGEVEGEVEGDGEAGLEVVSLGSLAPIPRSLGR